MREGVGTLEERAWGACARFEAHWGKSEDETRDYVRGWLDLIERERAPRGRRVGEE